jgi:superoxide dismutase
MAKGAKDKNRSQDNNIDYPGIQIYKEKYRELDFNYNSLETLVKKLLLNIQVGPKNKTYVNELCKIVGFDLETTNKILNNKNNKKLLGLFQK